MKTLLVLTALLLFNLGATFDLLGVGPGAAAGRLVYPNGTQVGVVVYADGRVALYPWYAVIDASRHAVILVNLHDARIIYECRGAAWDAGNYTRTPPPLSIASDGETLIAGDKLVLCNGSVLQAPGTVADRRGNSILVQLGRDTLLIHRDSALLYKGVSPVALCNETTMLVSMKGRIGVLNAETGVLTLYDIDGFQAGWGNTLDYSIAYCDQTVLVITGLYKSRLSALILIPGTHQCRVYSLASYPSSAGVAGDDESIYIGFASPPPLNATSYTCNYTVERLTLVPRTLEARMRIIGNLHRAVAPAAHWLTVRSAELSPVSDNLVLLVLARSQGAATATTTSSHLHYVMAAAAAALILLVLMVWRLRVVGGVRTSSRT